MGDPPDGISGEMLVIAGEVEVEPLSLISVMGAAGNQRASSRPKRAKSVSPRLRLVEMKRGGLRRCKSSSSVVNPVMSSRRKANRHTSHLNSIPEIGEQSTEDVVEGDLGTSGIEELGIVGFSEQGDRRMEEVVGQDVAETSGCGGMEEDMGKELADKVFVDLPQGVYIEGGRLLAVED